MLFTLNPVDASTTLQPCFIYNKLHIGCVHMRTNHVSKDVSDRDPNDWDRDLNYMRSHVLQTPSQSRSGSAYCEVIFCSHCAVRADWPMHGFSAHFQNAHARITFRKSFAFTCLRIRISRRITIQNALFFVFQNAFQKPDLKHAALRSQGLKSGFQIRKGPNHVPKRLSERDSFSCEQAHFYTPQDQENVWVSYW